MKIEIPDPQPLTSFVPAKYDILMYGFPKTGKTEFAATWSEAGNVLFIDAGNGLLTVKTAHKEGRLKDISNIYRVPIKDEAPSASIKQPIGWITISSIMNSLKKDKKYGDFAPKTVVLDELTTASQYALRHVLWVNNHAGQQPTQPDWGKLRNELINFLNNGRALEGINFIVLAHEAYQKDELSGRIWCLPDVVGKLASQIALYFDEVYHAKVQQIGGNHKYLMDTKSTGMIQAGSRFDLATPIPTTYKSIEGTIERLQQKGGEVKQQSQLKDSSTSSSS